jgi:hypothetical protein
MQLDLTDEEAAALLRELNKIIENDRYPLSPCIRTLRGILAKFGPIGPATPSPPRPPTPEERDRGERCAQAGHGVRCAKASAILCTDLEHHRARDADLGLIRNASAESGKMDDP